MSTTNAMMMYKPVLLVCKYKINFSLENQDFSCNYFTWTSGVVIGSGTTVVISFSRENCTSILKQRFFFFKKKNEF